MSKTSILFSGLILSLVAGQVTAQTFTTLHSFGSSGNSGSGPTTGPLLSDNTLYGTTAGGGNSTNGTVFAVNADGSGFRILHSFEAGSGNFPNITNSDGASPQGTLILSSNTLYGSTFSGGNSGNGTLFSVNTDGTGFRTLYSFTPRSNYTNADGANPQAGLLLAGNTLYGTATAGGSSETGTVFRMNPDGTGFTNLHSFMAWSIDTPGNSDGIHPAAGLILSGDTLYGTAAFGGSFDLGTVFAVNTDGTGFKTLHSFSGGTEGSSPEAGLLLSGGTLYGTTYSTGGSGNGTVFAINADGMGFRTLYAFSPTSGSYPFTNSDGADPWGGLVLSSNTLYGTTRIGGISGNGTIFAVNTNGDGFRNLYTFTVWPFTPFINPDGAAPLATLILSGDTLYGTAQLGGSSGSGTVFAFLLHSVSHLQLTLTQDGHNVVVTWPTNATGLSLQSTTNLSPAFWTTVTVAPAVDNGQNTLTNSITAMQQFYRLSR